MGDENPIRNLGDYSKPSHEGYRNTIVLPVGNNVVPLLSDTIRLVQDECSFHRLRSEDPNQHLKDFLKLVDSLDLDVANKERTRLRSISTWEDLTTRLLTQFFPPGRTAKLRNDILMFQQHQGESLSKAWTRFKDLLQKVPHHGIDLWLQVQIFNDHVNPTTRRTIDQSADGKLHDRNADEYWALLEDLALYDNESWNDPRDFGKLVKPISLHQDAPSTSDRHLIKLENQVQRLMEAHLAPKQSVQQPNKSHDDKSDEEEKKKGNPKNINTTPPSPLDPSISFIKEKVCKLNSFLESSGLVPRSSNTKFICTKEDDGDVMFIEIIKKYDDSHEEELEMEVNAMTEGLGVEYFDTFPTRSELAYHKMHVFIGNFTYVIDFMIVEDIGSIIDPRLSQVVLGKPFIEMSNMTHDLSLRVVKFTDGINEIAYKMPHKIGQYDSLLDL
ncbi:MAK10-like protein [Tanacetum coccineum]